MNLPFLMDQLTRDDWDAVPSGFACLFAPERFLLLLKSALAPVYAKYIASKEEGYISRHAHARNQNHQ